MNDTSTQTNGSGAGNGNGSNGSNGGERAFLLQQMYVKHMSFESPNSPDIFQQSGIEPETELSIRNSHSVINDNTFEVVFDTDW